MIIKRTIVCKTCGAEWDVDYDTEKEDLVCEDEWICPDAEDENDIHITELGED